MFSKMGSNTAATDSILLADMLNIIRIASGVVDKAELFALSCRINWASDLIFSLCVDSKGTIVAVGTG